MIIERRPNKIEFTLIVERVSELTIDAFSVFVLSLSVLMVSDIINYRQ